MGEDTGRTDGQQPARGYRELDSSEGHADESTVHRNAVMFRTAHVGDTGYGEDIASDPGGVEDFRLIPRTRVKGSC